jgi:uncharacterized membrane protein
MNIRKILVALFVVAVIVIGSVSTVSAFSSIRTSTDATATSIRSSTYLSISNTPVTSIYESYYVAKLLAPTFPPVDMSYSRMDVTGDRYVQRADVVSTPSGASDSSSVSNPSSLRGKLDYYNCALWAANQPPYKQVLPTTGNVAGNIWTSGHRAGMAARGTLSMRSTIYRP